MVGAHEVDVARAQKCAPTFELLTPGQAHGRGSEDEQRPLGPVVAGERDGLHSLAEPHLVAEEKPSVECKSGRHAIALEGQKFGLVDHSLARRSEGRLACRPAELCASGAAARNP